MASIESSVAATSPKGHARRFSTLSAARADWLSSPSIVMPSSHLMTSSNPHETPKAMEIANTLLGDDLSVVDSAAGSASTMEGQSLISTDRYAFAFDIDGVLVRGGDVIPAARLAMKVLNGDNKWRVKVPYIFITNGGGKTEEERCRDLSQQLGLEIFPGQFICGHTPMGEMVDRYQTVLVVGGEGEKCREVAESYGFQDVVTPGDIIKYKNDTTPFRKLTPEELQNSRSRDFRKVRVEAVFVIADSRDWAGDQQIILDLCMSKNGFLCTRSKTYDEGPPVYFSHNDLVWPTSHEHTRLGMGALRANVEATFKNITGKELKTIAFGKPQLGTFQYATRLLRQWRKAAHGIDSPLGTVYFVGDTPESDIRGTNEFNESSTKENEWYSILVKTGVFQGNDKPKFPPRKTCNTVLDAVKFAMQRESVKEFKGTSMGRPGSKVKATITQSLPSSFHHSRY